MITDIVDDFLREPLTHNVCGQAKVIWLRGKEGGYKEPFCQSCSRVIPREELR